MSPWSRTWLTGRTVGSACRVKTILPNDTLSSSTRRRGLEGIGRLSSLTMMDSVPFGTRFLGSPDMRRSDTAGDRCRFCLHCLLGHGPDKEPMGPDRRPDGPGATPVGR